MDRIGWSILLILFLMVVGVPVFTKYVIEEEKEARQLCEQRGGYLLRDRAINVCIDRNAVK